MTASTPSSSRLSRLEGRIAESIPLQLQANQEMAEEIVRVRAENRRLRSENAELKAMTVEGSENVFKELRVLREENAILRRRCQLRSRSPTPVGVGFDKEIRSRCESSRGRSPSAVARLHEGYRHAAEYVAAKWRPPT